MILRLINVMINPLLHFLDRRELTSYLLRIAHRFAANTPADDALRFLLELENGLYELAGEKAVAYGGGVHTKHRHTKYHNFFISRVYAGDRVLDVGCGVGVLSCAMARKNVQVVAVDIDTRSIEAARTRFADPGISYVVGDILTLDIPGPFNVVVLSNVLEHLRDRQTFLSQLVTRFGPERMLVRVPLFERDWRVPLKKELGVEWRLDQTHETEYTHEAFAEEVRLACLRICHIEVRWGEIWCELRPQ